MAEERLRERKKRQTREAIAAAARRLFRERGFDAVTVAEVASAADVSEQTVFNYFRTKEDLFFSGMQTFEEQLVDAVRQRAPGESALLAFRRSMLSRLTGLGDPRAAEAITSAARLIAASPTLQSRERSVLAQQTRALAGVLAEGSEPNGAGIEVLVAANALMGVHAAVLERVRALALRGPSGPELVTALEAEVVGAFDRLEHGLRDYAIKEAGQR